MKRDREPKGTTDGSEAIIFQGLLREVNFLKKFEMSTKEQN